MDLLDEPKEPRRSRGAWVAIALAIVVAVGAGVWWLVRRPAPEAAPNPGLVQRTRPMAKATATPAAAPGAATGTLEVQSNEPNSAVSIDGKPLGDAPRSVELKAGRHRVRVAKDGFEPWELDVHVVPGRTAKVTAALSGEAPRLRVDSDVPGASVFLDRKFLGTTPVETRGVAPGSHRLNVSAEGYEMYGEQIEVEKGRREVMVRFKEVRLDEKLAVAHKHAVGSCRGTLLATTAGLRYEAAATGDGFQADFSSLDPLQVDYLKKNLRVRVRGGKTYNFTADSADQLLSFQKAVEAARKRL